MSKMTELFSYIKANDLDQVAKVVAHDPSILNQYLYGVTPFQYSIECGSEPIALELLKSPQLDILLKDNLETSCLELAVENKLSQLVEALCKRFSKSQMRDFDFRLDPQETLLTYCLKNGDIDTTAALVRGGADLNAPNKNDEYPLQLAIRFNQKDVVGEMLKSRDLNAGTLPNGYNPLLDACENDAADVAAILIDSNRSDIDLSVQKEDEEGEPGWTPLMHSILNNNEPLALKLIEKKSYLDLIDGDGNTALHLAVLAENDYLVRHLLRADANKDIQNKEGLRPLDIAKLNEDEACLELLR